jgi:hypothetical protein
VTRLSAVSWTGGATGNWFDPANWAGGAVPDLSNVANVVIPQSRNVSFGSVVVAPAQTGPVNVDSIGATGGMRMTGGVLNVGSGGVQLASLAQTGGQLGVIGNLVVTDSFSQGQSGSISVAGSTSITDTSAGMVIGNLNATGALEVVSTGGDIAQAIGTQIVANNSSFAATNGGNPANITLNGTVNNFVGPISLSGQNISVVDGTGGLVLGQVVANGQLDVSSTGGDITQANGTNIVANGSSRFAATVGGTAANITLGGAANDFVGPVSLDGQNVTVVDGSGGLVMDDISSTGRLDVTASGAITQRSGSRVVAAGAARFSSATGNIQLTSSNNAFAAGVTGVDTPKVIGPSAPSAVTLPMPGSSPPVIDMAGGQTQVSASAGAALRVAGSLMGSTTGGAASPAATVRVVDATSGSGLQMIQVSVPSELASAVSGFSFSLPASLLAKAANTDMRFSLLDGSALPVWLRYEPENQRFISSNVPAGALPLAVQATFGAGRTLILIKEVND